MKDLLMGHISCRWPLDYQFATHRYQRPGDHGEQMCQEGEQVPHSGTESVGSQE